MATLERFPRRAGIATVVRREHLTPRMLRLTLAADDFGAGWPIEQPGEILTLLFPDEGEQVVLPEQGWRFPAGAPEQHWRNYTVRDHRPAERAIDVDVVLHEPHGPACTGAERSEIGALVGYAGPRIDFAPAAGEPPVWLLLCGDETALPAIAAILKTRPAELPVTALVEIHDRGEQLPVALKPRQELHWLSRDGHPAGASSDLVDALRSLRLPDGPGQAWGAAESRVARDLRELLRDHHGMPRSHARARGYWLRSGDWLDEEA